MKKSLIKGLTKPIVLTIFMSMKEVQISNTLKLREDGKLFFIKTGKEYIPAKSTQWIGFRVKVDGHTKYVHTLVLELFGSPKPEGNYRAWHKNRDAYDNRLDNLEWVTVEYASSHRKDALPVGQRKCDFENENEYRCSNTKRYQSKNKEKIKFETQEKHNNVSRIRYNTDEETKRKHREACKRYEESHKEELKEKRKIWSKNWREKQKQLGIPRKRNKELEAECTKAWRENNKEKYKLIQKINNEKNKEQRREYLRKWRAEHPEKVEEYKEHKKEWYKEHPNYRNEQYLKRMSDPEYREKLYRQQRDRSRFKRATDEEFHQHELEYRREYRARKKEENEKARGTSSEPLDSNVISN